MTAGAENLRRANEVADWAVAEKIEDRVLPPQVLLTGILYALTAQAEELATEAYGPGQDTVTVYATGDNRDQLLQVAYWEAEQFFGPERRFEIAEPWGASLDGSSRQYSPQKARYVRSGGLYGAAIVFKEAVSRQDRASAQADAERLLNSVSMEERVMFMNKAVLSDPVWARDTLREISGKV